MNLEIFISLAVGLLIICFSLSGVWRGFITTPAALAYSFFCISAVFISFCGSTFSFIFLYTLVLSLGILLKSSLSRHSRINPCVFSMLVIVLAAIVLLFSTNVLTIVLSFELMVFASLVLLFLTSKFERHVESLIEMYVWAVIGSAFLILGLVLYSYESFFFGLDFTLVKKFQKELSVLFLSLGFFIKIPLWPFTSWLLKAHVEASTEFSIFLSGCLVKFGVIALFKLHSEFCSHQIQLMGLILSTCGIIEACFRLFGQVDLKRVIALATIIETNWLVFMFFLSSHCLELVSLTLVLIHALATTCEFLFVEYVYRRFHTRQLNKISGISFLFPKLNLAGWLIVLVLIGLPGTSIFTIKLYFFVELFKVNYLLFSIFTILFLIVLPCYFIRIFSCLLGGQPAVLPKSCKNNPADLSVMELFLLGFCICVIVFVSLNPLILL